MEGTKAKKGSLRLRIIESDSESEVEDVNELSMSMKRVTLVDEFDPGEDCNLRDTDDDEDDAIENEKTPRKPPRGRNIQKLDDFSWSSSEEDGSDESCSTSCSSNRKQKPKKSVGKNPTILRTKSNASNLLSSSARNSTPFSSRPNTSHTPPSGRSLPEKPKARHSDVSLSDDSLSIFSDSDDELSLMSTESNKKNSKKKKNFSWSFNKNRKEYTIGGNGQLPAFSIPSDLYDQLYDFQKEGVAWMAGLHLPRIGGILGDDMGMGKTYTTLAFLGGLMKANAIKRAVVVAPVSVLRNWENEAKKILRQCVGIKIQVISSVISVNKRKKILHQALEAQSPQLVITSYGVVAKNPDHFTQHVVGKKVWDYVILDEAHTIKNPTTQNNQAVWLIAKSNKTRRLILTGTPIMNNLKDLHTLFDFATSGQVLGSHKDFRNEYGNPIEAARSADAEEKEVEMGESAMEELQHLIQPYFLQRTKSEYLAEALPPKHEYVLWTKLSPLQRELYTKYVESEYVCGILGGEAKSPLFAITWLQKLCGHPLLVKEESVDSIDNFDEHDPNELMAASAKLEVMYNLVDNLVLHGHRILIFSQSTTVLDIIERVLNEEFKLSRIDGQTKEKDRQKYVDEFNQPESEIDAMLISTKAGGQGLTLTGADSCIVYDPSWNPAEDAQAVDRCYRLGQRKKVQVFRLITAGTVEEKRYEKQIHKDGIRRTILTNTGNNTAKYFTKEELRKTVFVLGEDGECEFLNKLEKKGFAYDETKNPDHSHSSLDGVIGQSSHDVVYSLPENFYLEETIKSPTQQPFSSPPTATQWVSTKAKPTFMGRSQADHSKETDSFNNKENKIKDDKSKIGKIQIIGGGSNTKLENSDSQSNTCSSILLEKSLSKVKSFRSLGRKEEAVSLLMDLLDDQNENLSKSDVSKLHNEMAEITNELGWL